MLYPEICINSDKKTFKEKIKYVKDSILVLLMALSRYDLFVLFLEQKFHF